MSLFDQISNDIKAAMLARESGKLEALRSLKAAMLIAKTEGAYSKCSVLLEYLISLVASDFDTIILIQK